MDTSSGQKSIKLSCSGCNSVFYTMLPVERALSATCPNCNEKKLELAFGGNNNAEKDSADGNIPIRS